MPFGLRSITFVSSPSVASSLSSPKSILYAPYPPSNSAAATAPGIAYCFAIVATLSIPGISKLGIIAFRSSTPVTTLSPTVEIASLACATTSPAPSTAPLIPFTVSTAPTAKSFVAVGLAAATPATVLLTGFLAPNFKISFAPFAIPGNTLGATNLKAAPAAGTNKPSNGANSLSCWSSLVWLSANNFAAVPLSILVGCFLPEPFGYSNSFSPFAAALAAAILKSSNALSYSVIGVS